MAAPPLTTAEKMRLSWAQFNDYFSSLALTPSREVARVSTWKNTGIVALRDANLKVLPIQVWQEGSSARTLDATNNKLTELPNDIEKLTNLQRLMLGENRLEEIPVNIGQLSSLKVLTLDKNRLSSLPDEVCLLLRLERLSMAQNFITLLPLSLGNLKKLKLLDIRGNKVNSLPSSIGECESLEEIVASDNQILELPDSICSLKQIKTLLLDGNRIDKLPLLLLVECERLQTLSLHRNPILHLHFEQMEGYAAFEGRRRDKVDKQIAGNVMMGSKNLDDGLDRS